MNPTQALAATLPPACPDDGRMAEFTPPPSPNTREWACVVCGLVARAEATPQDGYLLWHARPGRTAGVTSIMIAIGDST